MKDKSSKFQVPSPKSKKGIISFSWLFPWNLEFGIWNFGLIIGVIGLACNKEEPIPSYIHIDKITLSTVYATQGSSSHKIVDAWIYIDDQLIGAFELPCTVPVLYAGSHTIKILPGIKENGISETRISYPFYDIYDTTITLTQGQITTIHPTTVYSQGADFSWLENFEGSSPGVCDTADSDTVMRIITTPPDTVFEGGCGGVFLGSGTTKYLGVSCNKYILPKGELPVFLELNYKCNTDFNIGIIGYRGGTIDVQSISLTLRPTNGWNKMYVNLTNEISNATNSTEFAIFFSMLKNAGIPTSYFYLDNVKLVN